MSDPFRASRRDTLSAPWLIVGGGFLFAFLIGLVLWSFGVFHFGRENPVDPKVRDRIEPSSRPNDPQVKEREPTPRVKERDPARLGIVDEESERINVYKTVKPSVINVDTLVYTGRGFNGTQAERQGTGSGFIWDEAGRIVTNFHVIRDALALRNGDVIVAPGRRIVVTLASGESIDAQLVGIAPDTDLAVIQLKRLPEGGVRKIAIGSSHDLEVGQTIFAIGSPFGQSFTFTHGIISALDRSIQSPTQHIISGVIQVDAPINPGNSGGPLLDRQGRLLGVNTAITTPSGGSVGLGYAIPIDSVNTTVTALIRSGRTAQPYIGAVYFLDERKLRRANIPKGVLVSDVRPGSPAEAAGLERGDLIVRVDNKELIGLAELEKILNRIKVGDTIVFTVRRDDREVDIRVVVEGI